MKTRIHNINKLVSWSPKNDQLEEIRNVEILISNGKIAKIDKKINDADNSIDANNCLITPGFIDSHTHPIFIGNRANEYKARASGVSYQDIYTSGGGIISSIKKLRNATREELYNSSSKNIIEFIRNGTTLLEAKSGYGLTVSDEIKSLQVIKKLNKKCNIDIVSTFLGAHAMPPEFKSLDDYVELICKEMIPEIAQKKLAEFCDVFCEKGYFTVKQARKILQTAIKYDLKPRLHADEFVDSGAAKLAGEIGAFSADHLMEVSNEGIRVLAENNVMATLLPGTTLFLGEKKYANGRKLIDSGVEVALATDFNPGSCTINSIPIIMGLSILYCGLTVEEAFKGVTWNAAKSLNRQDRYGLIAQDYVADLLFWDIDNIEEIPYWFSNKKIKRMLKSGLEIKN